MRIGYLSSESVQVVQLPYKGGRLAMLVVLPRKRNDLQEVERVLSARLVKSWMNGVKDHHVSLSLPRFDIAGRYQLNHTLTQMGMGNVFGSQADWSGLSPNTKIALGGVIHEAHATVIEEGTEAAAATVAAVGVPTSTPELLPTATLVADHPFLFFVIDLRSGTVLLCGRVSGRTTKFSTPGRAS